MKTKLLLCLLSMIVLGSSVSFAMWQAPPAAAPERELYDFLADLKLQAYYQGFVDKGIHTLPQLLEHQDIETIMKQIGVRDFYIPVIMTTIDLRRNLDRIKAEAKQERPSAKSRAEARRQRKKNEQESQAIKDAEADDK